MAPATAGKINELNKEAYRATEVVAHYSGKRELFKPEVTILELFRDQLPQMRFLDIGVGAGRTTSFIAPLVQEYLGVDYSDQMIAYCRQSFPQWSFKVMDVRAMAELPSDYFDFVFFSYNGLDSIDHADRLLALQEMRRVCRPNGHVCFSSHNLQSIDQLFRVRFSFNPFILARRLARAGRLRRRNPPLATLRQLDYAIIHDGTHNFRIANYYIKPAYQLQQLAALGFTNIRLFAYSTGQEIDPTRDLAALTDYMLYYLGTKG